MSSTEPTDSAPPAIIESAPAPVEAGEVQKPENPKSSYVLHKTDICLLVFVVIGFLVAAGDVVMVPWMSKIMAEKAPRCTATLVAPILGVGISISVIFFFTLPVLAYFFVLTPQKRLWQWWPLRTLYGFGLSVIYVGLFIIGILCFAVIMLKTTPPFYDRNYSQVEGIDGDIVIRRNNEGVPTISASTLRDALFGQGFVHAQDRISQMVLERAAAKGEISKLIGASGLDYDRMSRTYNMRAAADKMCNGLDADSVTLLQSYAAGINLYLDKHPNLPLDMHFYGGKILLPYKPDSFVWTDVCASFVQLQIDMSLNCDRESDRWSRMFDSDSKTATPNWGYDDVEKRYPVAQYLDDFDADGLSILSEADIRLYGPGSSVLQTTASVKTASKASRDLERQTYLAKAPGWKSMTTPAVVQRLGVEVGSVNNTIDPRVWMNQRASDLKGSNAWVVRDSNYGPMPIVASDPHLQLHLPSVWYYAKLEISTVGNFVGTSHPGIPGILVGSTDFVSWGITLSMSDLCDLFVLDPDPANPTNAYIVNGQSIPYTVRQEVIEVKDDDPQTITVKESQYGPLVDGLKTYYPTSSNAPMAMSHVALQGATSSILSILNIVRGTAKTVKDFREKIIAGITAPGLSMAIADTQGGIGWGMTGMHPIRSNGHTGRYPIPGNGQFDYKGYVPMNELPYKVQPVTQAVQAQRDFIVAANNKPYPGGYKYNLGYDFYPYLRSRRIQEQLATMPVINPDTMKQLQLDSRSNAWEYLFKPLWAADQSLQNGFSDVREMLKNWNGMITTGNVYPALFWEVLYQIAKLADPKYTPQTRVEPIFVYYYAKEAANRDNVVGGWKNLGNPGVWGDDWGYAMVPNSVLANSLLECLGSRFPNKKSGGDETSVNPVRGRKLERKASEASSGASIRQIFVLPSTVYFSLPGGNSENPMSPFYDNRLEDWANGIYVSVSIDKRAGSGTTYQQTLSKTTK